MIQHPVRLLIMTLLKQPKQNPLSSIPILFVVMKSFVKLFCLTMSLRAQLLYQKRGRHGSMV